MHSSIQLNWSKNCWKWCKFFRIIYLVLIYYWIENVFGTKKPIDGLKLRNTLTRMFKCNEFNVSILPGVKLAAVDCILAFKYPRLLIIIEYSNNTNWSWKTSKYIQIFRLEIYLWYFVATDFIVSRLNSSLMRAFLKFYVMSM